VGCDPRALAPGEVRARQIPCSDELIDGGEGRVGDWLLENAYARYVIRGVYASLTHLDEEGGTLIDAAAPGGVDLLSEYLPDADRTEVATSNSDGEAMLVSPGVTWRLTADSDTLWIDGPSGGTLQGLAGVDQAGATLQDGDAFFGLDGSGLGEGSAVRVEGATHAALSAASVWPDGDDVHEEVDADDVLAIVDEIVTARLPVVDGVASGTAPAGARLLGEREGCTYTGLSLVACGSLFVRVADSNGDDIAATLTDGVQSWPLPVGGGRAPVGPDPRTFRLWAGPTHSVATVPFLGGDAEVDVVLRREVETDDSVLAALEAPIAPDADTRETAEEAAHRLAAEGVGFAVALADDEVPSVTVDAHDAILLTPGSRAGAVVWSWPWSQNGKRAAHGAVDWGGLSALDLLAVTEGGASTGRLTVVDAFWVARARIEADPWRWDPRPDAFWLRDLGGLSTYLALVAEWIEIAPVGPRTWIDIDTDRNLVAYEAGIVDSRTSAGNGPRVRIRALDGHRVGVELAAPQWMAMRELVLWTDLREVHRRVDGAGDYRFDVGEARWAVVVATGDRARPDSEEGAWAVSAPVWLKPPGYEGKE
jgi:hypothetical protein